jgi:hypothetical protein
MLGLDPGIHEALQIAKTYENSQLPDVIMDCRVKPGNDNGMCYLHRCSLTVPPGCNCSTILSSSITRMV